MKLPFTLLILFIGQITFAQKADDILGIWLTDQNKGKIKVYKKSGKYYGKIIWLNDNTGPNGAKPKLDVNNPDPKKQDRPLVGTTLVKDLRWDSDEKEWTDGEIYDPESGNTYSVYAWMEKKGTLNIKGYIGFSLLGRTTEWTRAD